jgi:hypothetical protein
LKESFLQLKSRKGKSMNWRELTIKYVKDLLRAKTPMEVAEKELIEAQHAKMQAETSVEYSQALVNYNEQRIFRLYKRINDLKEYGHDR